MAEESTEDPEGTVAATTDGEDTVDESTVTEAMEAGGTTTGTQTTPETGRTAQETENPEAGGTPGGRLETGRTEGGTTAAMAGAPTTAIRRCRDKFAVCISFKRLEQGVGIGITCHESQRYDQVRFFQQAL